MIGNLTLALRGALLQRVLWSALLGNTIATAKLLQRLWCLIPHIGCGFEFKGCRVAEMPRWKHGTGIEHQQIASYVVFKTHGCSWCFDAPWPSGDYINESKLVTPRATPPSHYAEMASEVWWAIPLLSYSRSVSIRGSWFLNCWDSRRAFEYLRRWIRTKAQTPVAIRSVSHECKCTTKCDKESSHARVAQQLI